MQLHKCGYQVTNDVKFMRLLTCLQTKARSLFVVKLENVWERIFHTGKGRLQQKRLDHYHGFIDRPRLNPVVDHSIYGYFVHSDGPQQIYYTVYCSISSLALIELQDHSNLQTISYAAVSYMKVTIDFL